MSDVFNSLRDLMVERLNVAPEKVTLEASFREDLGVDSLDTVELVMEIEDQFGIEINDDDAQKITTVKDLVSYIEKGLMDKK